MAKRQTMTRIGAAGRDDRSGSGDERHRRGVVDVLLDSSRQAADWLGVSAATMWRVLTLVALLWPSRIASVFDGVPLDTAVECILVGLVVPALLWFHPSFVKQFSVRAAIAAILLCKLGMSVAM